MQIELFPAYPRLPEPAPAKVYDFSEAWKQFDYPSEDLNAMPQCILQSDITTYLKSVFEGVFGTKRNDYLVSDDIFVYYTTRDSRQKDTEGNPKATQHQKAPDIFIATPVLPYERKSFIKEQELALLGDRQGELRMIAIEMLSDANYADKTDQPKRYFFYNGLGVEEYIVIHTQPSLSLEVFWRIDGHLQRTLFYENYKIQMLNVSFEIETVPATADSPAIERLHLIASDGTRFNNYAQEHETRKEAEKKLEVIEVVLKEYQEEYQAEQEARLEAEKRTEEERKRAKKAEKRAEEAEEKARQVMFELEELRNLLKVQQRYE
jgi:hypothetical protein